jgi:ketosteroid isomerase-like protein
MAQENVEVVRRLWRERDAKSVFEFYDPAIIWESHYGPISGAYQGHEGVRQFFREWTEPLDTFRARAETFIDAGASVVVGTRVWAKGKGSGVEGEMPQGMVYTLRNGLVTRVDLYETKEMALEAVGLSEQDAHADSS